MQGSPGSSLTLTLTLTLSLTLMLSLTLTLMLILCLTRPQAAMQPSYPPSSADPKATSGPGSPPHAWKMLRISPIHTPSVPRALSTGEAVSTVTATAWSRPSHVSSGTPQPQGKPASAARVTEKAPNLLICGEGRERPVLVPRGNFPMAWAGEKTTNTQACRHTQRINPVSGGAGCERVTEGG